MNNTLRAASLLLGPLLTAVATFFWEDTRHGLTASVIGLYATVAGVYGTLYLWDRLTAWKPWVGATGLVIALLGFLGGVAFSLQGVFEGLFDVSKTASLDAAAAHPAAANLVLWLPGPAYPLSLAALAIALAWSRLAPWPVWAGLLCSAVCFPLSRITRTEWVAHVADLLILAVFAALALLVLRGRLDPAPATTP
ncbi:hypothetical protein GCM10009853_069640 [Glycomyces scopariae]